MSDEWGINNIKAVSNRLKFNSLMPLISDYLKDFVISLDDNGNILYANRSMLNALQYSLSEIEFKPFLNLLHPEDLERTVKAFEESKETGLLGEFKNRYIRRDGTALHLKWRQSFTVNGITIGISEETD